MNSIKAIRLKRYEDILAAQCEGKPAQLARDLGIKNPGQLYRLTSPTGSNRGIGDELARRIEKRYGKPVGWMDHLGPAAPLPSDIPPELIADFRALLPDDRRRFLARLAIQAKRARAYREAAKAEIPKG